MKVVLFLSAIVLAAYAGRLSSNEARVEDNVDYWGADIRSFRSRGLRDCYNACRRQGGCRSFTMRKRDNYCWLKRRVNGARRMIHRRHLISANLVMHRVRSNMNMLRGNEARVENNVDYWGADIRSFRSRGLRDCYNACRRQGGCRSFTMRKRDHYCWLKRRVNGARRMIHKGHLISANLVMRSAARALKMRRMKVYRGYIAKYKRAAALQRKRLRAYNLRYNKAHRAVVINARWTNKMVKLANAQARAANNYAKRYAVYRRKFNAVRAGCIKAQRKWRRVANAQARGQRAMIARMKVYKKRAALYKRRYRASMKLFRTRGKQRKAAYALYNKYIKTSNYWVKRYNVVARG